MRDIIYLSVGDTTVPFRNYDGDTRAYCHGLRDAFRYLGLDAEVSESLLGCIEEKPTVVQKVFLLRVCGLRTGKIAEVTGIPGRSVRRYAHQDVEDVRRILMDWVRPVPEHSWPN